jgi:hypothetical protein
VTRIASVEDSFLLYGGLDVVVAALACSATTSFSDEQTLLRPQAAGHHNRASQLTSSSQGCETKTKFLSFLNES